MRSKILTLSIGCFLAAFFFQFTQAERIVAQEKNSELALLMRDIVDDAQTTRAQVIKGEKPNNQYKKFSFIHQAIPTDSSVKTVAFKAMSDGYLKSLKTFYKSNKEGKIQAYNVMIANCLNCHKTYCPGPVKRIQKLRING